MTTKKLRDPSKFKPGQDVGRGPWKGGFPPKTGWWPASQIRAKVNLRYFDKETERWSDAFNVRDRPGFLYMCTRPLVQWRERAWDNTAFEGPDE